MRVLVTGAAGFIGSHICDRLVADHTVFALDNLLTGRKENLPERAAFIEGDVANPDHLRAIFDHAEPQVVVHAAASYNDPRNWERDLRTNAIGSALVARNAHRHGSRIVYFQTSLCYGLNPPSYPLGTSHTLDPHGSYAVSKTAGERYIRDSGCEYVSFRLANIYGPRNLSGPIPTFYKRLKADQRCVVSDTRRDFVYIDDAVDVFVQAIHGKGSGIYHVSTGGDYSIWSLWKQISSAMGGGSCARKPHDPDDAATILLDPTRTVREFGWAAKTPLVAGIRKVVDWYERHGVEHTFTHLAMR